MYDLISWTQKRAGLQNFTFLQIRKDGAFNLLTKKYNKSGTRMVYFNKLVDPVH